MVLQDVKKDAKPLCSRYLIRAWHIGTMAVQGKLKVAEILGRSYFEQFPGKDFVKASAISFPLYLDSGNRFLRIWYAHGRPDLMQCVWPPDYHNTLQQQALEGQILNRVVLTIIPEKTVQVNAKLPQYHQRIHLQLPLLFTKSEQLDSHLFPIMLKSLAKFIKPSDSECFINPQTAFFRLHSFQSSLDEEMRVAVACRLQKVDCSARKLSSHQVDTMAIAYGQ